MDDKIKRTTEIYGLDISNAEKEIKRIDKLRANHYKHYTDKEWGTPENYDLCINIKTFGVEKAADLIYNILQEKKLINM